MTRKRAKDVILSDEQREFLEKVSRSRTEEAGRVQRAKMILLAADGRDNTEIAASFGLDRSAVHRTLEKFHALGAEAALSDLPRKGRPPTITKADKAWIIAQACTFPKDLGYAQELWSISKLTAHVRERCEAAGHPSLAGVAQSKIWKILDEDGIKPHRIRYYMEKRDEDFDRKMNDVLILYKEMELELQGERNSGLVTVSFDEKPGIQAIAATSPDLPPTKEHGSVGRDHEYTRLGTLSLLAGLDLITGEVTALVRDTHKSADLIEFLKAVDVKYVDHERIRIVLDNHSAHTSKETRSYLETRPGRFEFVFTPKHGSWLNPVESFFGKPARVCLKGIRVRSKEEPAERLLRCIDEVNEVPVVYHWKYKMDEVEV